MQLTNLKKIMEAKEVLIFSRTVAADVTKYQFDMISVSISCETHVCTHVKTPLYI